jgi:cardiolipin synthase
MPWWHALEVQLTALAGAVCIALTIPWILMTKKESTSAVAWCLVVFFLPVIGTLFFVIFGYQHVHRPLKRKRRHKRLFKIARAGAVLDGESGRFTVPPPQNGSHGLARLAERFGAFPLSRGNEIVFYDDGPAAIDAILEAIAAAKHHVHLEYFIVQPDSCGTRLLALLAEKARQGVEVRLLYDAMGSRHLHRGTLRELRAAGGRCSVFLPLNPLRRRIQVNMRDHRKIVVVDGTIAFTGGLNIGNEYLGLSPRLGYWRDTHLRLKGPAVSALQWVFSEDWDFSADENLLASAYFPELEGTGPFSIQVIPSGPDQELNSIREIYFAAILSARKRLWIASPYFVPDAGLRDALCLAGYQGVDVRLLCQHHPDKWIPLFAARYYWADVLAAGVKVYQYTRGMLHSKVILVDDDWSSVGTANLDNRSLHLNFEVNCLIYGPEASASLERAFVNDLALSIRLQKEVFEKRPLPGRVIENACRLLSPIL